MGEANWSGNYEYRASRIVRPGSPDEIAELVTAATDAAPVRALGTRHTFNDLADPMATGTLISTAGLPAKAEVDEERRVVAVSSGLRYGDLALELQRQGWALANLASLPHISVAGAVATATHGSGSRNRNLAAAVAAVTFVSGTGELVALRRGDEGFDGAVVSLGALGIVTELELDVEPAYEIAQSVYLGVPYEHIDEFLDGAYSVSVFTDWTADAINHGWVKARTDAASDRLELFGATPALHKMHPIPSVDAAATTEQFGVPGAWHERLPHFRLDFQPSAGDEIQAEFLVPRRHAAAAIEGVRGIGERIAPILFTSELRAVAADGLWLSTAFSAGDDDWADGAVAFHFTFMRDQQAVEAAAAALEGVLAPFGARPHWGKVFTDAARVPGLYPRFADFRALVGRYDPNRVFRNPYTAALGL
ncbi:FAD-binding protein [Gryllotalpicola ginsengisoli]|uniref:FAD-binding protein n=1 Tax=Gryllotalpicola ginsengisoli TaxID=444608 RepID=UPI0003B40C0F|nr:FAD-binding protein [Gryllotalpicola ginsengisoli]